MNEVWLKEPSKDNESWAGQKEDILEWLKRSTRLRAQEMRLFLNHNLSKLPATFASELKINLYDRWNSAFLN